MTQYKKNAEETINQTELEIIKKLHQSMDKGQGGKWEIDIGDVKKILNTHTGVEPDINQATGIKNLIESEYAKNDKLLRQKSTFSPAKQDIENIISENNPDFITKITDMIKGMMGFEKSHGPTKIHDKAKQIMRDALESQSKTFETSIGMEKKPLSTNRSK